MPEYVQVWVGALVGGLLVFSGQLLYIYITRKK